MKTITVNASKTYDILIERGLLSRAGAEIRRVSAAAAAVIVTDSNIAPIYGDLLQKSMESAGFRVSVFVFPAGENAKNGDTYLRLLNFLAENRLTRTGLVLALGGGVTGDMAGFAAATYLRGVDFVQIPTSLLAMVDSSVGGKTAIDLAAGKNLAGAFYQPSLVLCDLDLLRTLPQAYFLDGCGEIVKYGVLGDEWLISHLEQNGLDFDRETVVARCIEKKRDVVAADEYDHGLRQTLNLGHTLAHAVEAVSSFTVSHGCAVAAGLAAMTRAAAAHGLCSTETSNRVMRVLTLLGLPVSVPYPMDALKAPLYADKKRADDELTLVVPRAVGRCELMKLPLSEAIDFLKAGI